MNTTATFSADLSFNRRTSTETVFSIQGHETDIVRDTSDTEYQSDDGQDVEYEPATEPEDEGDAAVDCGDSSGNSENEIISTKVIAVSMRDDGDLQFADWEQTDSASDSDMDLYDYWECAQCRTTNNNPLYRYCEKCFKVRKNFFPPRPKRKRKRHLNTDVIPRTLSQDSGVESQEFSQNYRPGSSTLDSLSQPDDIPTSRPLKRRAESVDRHTKRPKTDFSDSDSDSDRKSITDNVSPLVKTVSDPSITIEDTIKVTKKLISESLQSKIDDNLCITCFSEPKSGVFVHGRIAHICCCYKCAVKVWTKAKRCPVCNSKVSNVLKAVVM